MHRGCIPTKMFVYAADVAAHIWHSSAYGIDSQINDVRWPDVVIPAASHMVPVEQVDRVGRLIADFLEAPEPPETMMPSRRTTDSPTTPPQRRTNRTRRAERRRRSVRRIAPNEASA